METLQGKNDLTVLDLPVEHVLHERIRCPLVHLLIGAMLTKHLVKVELVLHKKMSWEVWGRGGLTGQSGQGLLDSCHYWVPTHGHCSTMHLQYVVAEIHRLLPLADIHTLFAGRRHHVFHSGFALFECERSFPHADRDPLAHWLPGTHAAITDKL